MKKILFYLAAIVAVVTSCTKEEPKTTFSFIATDGIVATTTEPLYSNDYYDVSFDVVFSEYGAGHRIAYQTLNGLVDNKKYTFEANPNTEYITVKLSVSAKYDSYGEYEFVRYMGNVILLEQGKNTEITFSPETMVTKLEPK